MIAKALAVFSLVILPLTVAFWHRSHTHPFWYRFDLTLYQSLDVYVKDGVCGLHLLAMPTKTASRTEFQARINQSPTANRASFLVRTERSGPYRRTSVVFPFWLATGMLVACGAAPIVRGPLRAWIRRHRGRCEHCGYDLRGSAGGRCPECGASRSSRYGATVARGVARR